MQTIDQILNLDEEEKGSKYYTSTDVLWNREWWWLEPPYTAFSSLTGEILDNRNFVSTKINYKTK